MIGFAGSWLRGASEATGGEGGDKYCSREESREDKGKKKNVRQLTILEKETDV